MADGLGPAAAEEPVRIADRVWAVGHHIPGDPFQCRVYLIENGDQSVLIDPGSLLSFDETLAKIRRVVPLDAIRWFVCHHQDPDVAGAMHRLDPLITRSDARLVTHGRAALLLRHMGLRIPFHRIEETGWRLPLPDRELRFVFTPYLHFPGAFCTFDPSTGVLFSSDLFGGDSPSAELWAEDESYFEAIRPFHEHYMPSNDVLRAGLRRLEVLPIRTIAPQHGQLVPERLVRPMFERLGGLDCGIYLMAVTDSDVAHLLAVNRLVRDSLRALVEHRELTTLAPALRDVLASVLPVDAVELCLQGHDGATLRLGPDNGYRGEPTEPLACWARDPAATGCRAACAPHQVANGAVHRMIVPLPLQGGHAEERACLSLRLREPASLSPELASALDRIGEPLGVSVEHDLMLQRLDRERAAARDDSQRDPLTGLYNRRALDTVVHPLLHRPSRGLTAVVADIDHFKAVNDTFGHAAGDTVLVAVSQVLRDHCRESDIPVRLGGEEFAVFVAAGGATATRVADRIRRAVERLDLAGPLAGRRVTISMGVAERTAGQGVHELLAAADGALYVAKDSGRNRVVAA